MTVGSSPITPAMKNCKFCGKEFDPKISRSKLYCCRNHAVIYSYKLKTLIKYFGFDKSFIETYKAEEEYERIRNMLYDLYWNKNKSSSDIAKMFNYTSHIENIANKVFKMLDIPKKTVSQAVLNNYMNGQIAPCSNMYRNGWYTTWNNKKVFLRSSYEFDYAKLLDEQYIDYEVEKLRISYYNTIAKSIKVAIPDFYIPSTNTIVEIKSNYTLDVQNMKDKIKAYKEAGYNFKLILEHKEIEDINNLAC